MNVTSLVATKQGYTKCIRCIQLAFILHPYNTVASSRLSMGVSLVSFYERGFFQITFTAFFIK